MQTIPSPIFDQMQPTSIVPHALEADSTLIDREQAKSLLRNLRIPQSLNVPFVSFYNLLFKDYRTQKEIKLPKNMFMFLIRFLFINNKIIVIRLSEQKIFDLFIEKFIKSYYVQLNLSNASLKSTGFVELVLENIEFPIETFATIIEDVFNFYSKITNPIMAQVFIYYLLHNEPKYGVQIKPDWPKLDSQKSLTQFFQKYQEIAQFIATAHCTDQPTINTLVDNFLIASPSIDLKAALEILDRLPEPHRNRMLLMFISIPNFHAMMAWTTEELILFTQLFDIRIQNAPFPKAYIYFENSPINGKKYSHEGLQIVHRLVQFTAQDSQNRLSFAQSLYGLIMDTNIQFGHKLPKNWSNLFAFCEEFPLQDFNRLGKKIFTVIQETDRWTSECITLDQQLTMYCQLSNIAQNSVVDLEKILPDFIKYHPLGTHLHDKISSSLTPVDMALQARRFTLLFKRYDRGGKEIQEQMIGEFLAELDGTGFLTEETRPLMYALYLPSGATNYLKGVYSLPTFSTRGIYLHEDGDVQFFLGSAEVAKQRIQNVISQNVTPLFWLGEYIKNAQQAGASKTAFELYLEEGATNQEEKKLTVVIRDNGCGMGLKEIVAFKTPGNTFKRQTVTDANFGQGIFTALAEDEFTTITVVTCKDGCCRIFKIEKEEESLRIYSEAETATDLPNGTEIILQKKMLTSPLNTAIYINSHLIQTCKYIQEMEVSLNGRPLTKPKRDSMVLSKSFIDREGQQQKVHLQFLDQEAGALYVNDLKTGPIPDSYFSKIPSFLKAYLQREQLSFALFLPRVEQVMGRSLIQADPTLESAMQHLLLQGSLIFMIEEWKKGHRLDAFISKDIWDVTTPGGYPLSAETKRLYQIVFGAELNGLALNEKEAKDHEELLAAVKEFLLQLPHEALPSRGVEGVMQQLHNQMQTADISWHTPHTILTLMAHYPLYPEGPSLHHLFTTIKNRVDGIINIRQLHELPARIQQKKIKKIHMIFASLVVEHPELALIIIKFKTTLLNRIEAMINQSSQTRHPPSLALAHFFKKLALQVYGRDIDVEFHSTPGNLAHIIRGTDKIYVNLLQDQLSEFESLVYDYAHGVAREQLMQQYGEVLSYWIKIFTHELTHLQEGSACTATHDKKFAKQAASNLAQFFGYPSNRNSTFDLLFRALDETLKDVGSQLELFLS